MNALLIPTLTSIATFVEMGGRVVDDDLKLEISHELLRRKKLLETEDENDSADPKVKKEHTVALLVELPSAVVPGGRWEVDYVAYLSSLF